MLEKLKKEWYTISTFAKIETKRSLRDKVALFFTFVFPLIFLFVFGGIFGGTGGASFKIALINDSSSDFSKNFVKTLGEETKTFKINEEAGTLDQAKEKMNRGEIDAAVVLPAGFGNLVEGKQYPGGEAQVVYNQNSEQAAQTLTSILNSTFTEINRGLVKSEAPFTVAARSTAEAGQRRFDYTFAGLLGFSILSLGIFGPTNVFPRLKEKGILKRLSTTTLRVRQFFFANALSYSVVGLMSVASLFICARIFFDLNMRGDYLSLALLVILGTFTMFGIGLAIGGWAKNESQAAPLSQIVVFPMMFLSGTFFPRFLMPEILQKISYFLPLTPLIDGARMIVTEGKTILEIGPQVGLLAAWAVVIYFIAFRVFRWE